MTTTVNIHEAKTHLSRLLEQVRAGERVIIAKAGEPIAELTPYRKKDIVFGGLKDVLIYDDDEFVAADDEVAALFDDAADFLSETPDARGSRTEGGR